MKGTQTVTVMVLVGTGSKFENKKNNGISHFLEHMFFKGTKKRPSTMAISSELDSIGADFNAFTSKEYTGYWVKAQKNKLEIAMDTVSDILLNSKFESKEIEREKGVIIEEVNMVLDNPMYYIEDVFEQCLYGNCPAGWDIIGTKKNIMSFQRKDFVDYLKSQYGAHNMCLVVVGNTSGLDVDKLAVKYFSDKRLQERDKKFQDKLETKEKQSEAQIKIHYKKTDQVHLALGVRTHNYASDKSLLAKFMAIVLGGSMSSRLFINLREKNGLCYYVRTNQETYSDTGYLVTRAGVRADKADKAIKIILSEYKKLSRTLISSEEMKKNKDLIKGKMAIQFEQSDNLANWYSRQAVMSKMIEREVGKKIEIKKPDEYLKEVDKISAKQIKDVAQEVFVESQLNLALIGPFKDGKRFESLLKL